MPAPNVANMTRAEALSVLGLKEGATRADIAREYKRLMLKVHPDHGGSEYLAAKLNQARDLLTRRT
ncbi:MAG: DnaJ domain-containing protein [Polyangiaceae bacterium]|nr:DnaJ domain-containing protein [Polyangiaceae bacterium]